MPVVNALSLPAAGPERERECCRVLEEGNILLFPTTPFAFPEQDRALLLEQRQVEAGYHKNIAYRPASDRVTGVARRKSDDADRLRRALRDYSQAVVRFASDLLPGYARRWTVD
ncbi:MAG TPA: Kdo hydroxylase family protein, partial [Thermoanaerobaculia bacterium]|nr:Kdo hydroxylase family protein [Thermoanaerobaculia bacterium]